MLSVGDGVGGVPLPPREEPRLAEEGVAAREVVARRGVGVEGALRRLVERAGAERAGLLVAIAFAGTVIGGDASAAGAVGTADGEAAAGTVAVLLPEAGAVLAAGAAAWGVVAAAAAAVEAAGVGTAGVEAGNALAGDADAVVVAGGVTAAAGGVRRDEGWREEGVAMGQRERTA